MSENQWVFPGCTKSQTPTQRWETLFVVTRVRLPDCFRRLVAFSVGKAIRDKERPVGDLFCWWFTNVARKPLGAWDGCIPNQTLWIMVDFNSHINWLFGEFWTINSICWKQSALKKIGVLEKIVPKNFGTQQNVSIFLLHHLARKQNGGLRHAKLPPNHLLNDNGTLFCFTFIFKEVPHVPTKERVSLRKTYLCTM